MTKITAVSIATLLFLANVTAVSAHVAIQPDKVGLALHQDFSVGVPNEKDIPTTQVRLVLPEGLENVTPYTKAGWNIEMKKTGEGDDARVTEINWKGGSIGIGLRDSFVFRAMTPSDPTTLEWKSYQTYSDGTLVSWDQEEKEGMTEEEEMEMLEKNLGPSSETKVVDDLTQSETKAKSSTDQMTIYVAYAALLIGALALVVNLRKRTS